MGQAKHNLAASLARDATSMALFPVSVLTHQLPASETLNARLAEIILEREKLSASASLSNIGGWQSKDDIFAWSYPEIAQLHDYTQKALQVATSRLPVPKGLEFSFKIYGWANVNRDGASNVTHVHPTSTWSCVYYVAVGNPERDDDNGNLLLHNPDLASVMSFFPDMLPVKKIIRPEPGLLVIFPSYVPHSVQPWSGDEPRISIAINAHGGLVRK